MLDFIYLCVEFRGSFGFAGKLFFERLDCADLIREFGRLCLECVGFAFDFGGYGGGGGLGLCAQGLFFVHQGCDERSATIEIVLEFVSCGVGIRDHLFHHRGEVVPGS